MIQNNGINAVEIGEAIPSSSGGGGGGGKVFSQQFIASAYTVPVGRICELFAYSVAKDTAGTVVVNGKSFSTQSNYESHSLYSIILLGGSVVTSTNSRLFFREYVI